MRVTVLIGIEIGGTLAGAPASTQVRSAPATSAAADLQDDEQPVVQQQQQQQTPLQTNQAGRIAQSSVGQRQTRDTAAAQAGIKPTARIASRIQNRVQNRIRNRIDRNYDPQAGATDPFAVAWDQARTTGRPR